MLSTIPRRSSKLNHKCDQILIENRKFPPTDQLKHMALVASRKLTNEVKARKKLNSDAISKDITPGHKYLVSSTKISILVTVSMALIFKDLEV